MRKTLHPRWRWPLASFAVLAGCAADAPEPAPPQRWSCPAGWLAYESGGCGPAVLLCGPEGGAAPGQCIGVDLSRPPAPSLPDGGTSRAFYRLPDGGVGGGWPEPGDPDGPPAAGWAPDAGIAACPEAWLRLADGTCDPALRADCPEGSVALPGGACTPTAARDCPAGEYATLGAETAGAVVVRVRAAPADPAPDGSVEHPYATLAAALAHAGADVWVLVARGEYRERLVASGARHVVGACAASVTLRGPESVAPNRPTIDVGRGATLDLRGLTLRGDGLSAHDGARVALSDVVVADNVGRGVFAAGAGTLVEVAASVVRGTRGHGLEALSGATLRAAHSLVADSLEVGVLAMGAGTRVALTGSAVRGTRPNAGGRYGYGLAAHAGATLSATDVLVDGNASAGVVAYPAGDAAPRVELVRCVVRGTRPNGDGALGVGLGAEGGATLRATDTLVADNVEQGVYASGEGTLVELASSVVRGTRPRAAGTFGRGLGAEGGATLHATDTLVADNAEDGVRGSGPGTRVNLTSCVVRGTRLRRDGTAGHGLGAGSGATLCATGTLIADNAEGGVVATGSGTEVDLQRSAVRDTRPRGDGGGGHGLWARSGATLRATGVRVDGNSGVGALSANDPGLPASDTPTQVVLASCVVRGTAGRDVGGDYGLAAQSGATLRATGVRVEDSGGAGVYAGGAPTRVELTSCLVRGTRALSGGVFGRGLEANGGAALGVTSSLVADSTEIGIVALGADTRVTVDDVLVDGVAPSARGFGAGLYVVRGARLDGARVAVRSVASAGVAALEAGGVQGARVSLRDLWVRGVRASTVRFSESGSTVRPEGRAVAYGLHADLACEIDVTRAVVDGGGYGFFNVGGAVRFHRGVIARQREFAGAVLLGADPALTALDDVTLWGNASDAVRAVAPPQASSLPSLPSPSQPF